MAAVIPELKAAKPAATIGRGLPDIPPSAPTVSALAAAVEGLECQYGLVWSTIRSRTDLHIVSVPYTTVHGADGSMTVEKWELKSKVIVVVAKGS